MLRTLTATIHHRLIEELNGLSTTPTQSTSKTLSDLYRERAFVLSYELFPPKTNRGRDTLREHLSRLVEFKPDYITCTYGAGGSTRSKTLDTLSLVREVTDVPVASHLTCVGSTVDDLIAYLSLARERGVDYIVAIRGDAPAGSEEFVSHDGGLSYANELVALIRKHFPAFGIVVGGYPETHPEAPDAGTDLDNLKRKVDSGADIVVSQMFYTNDDFYRWRDRCVAGGITVPLVPGILPITNFGQIKRIAALCGATLPGDLSDGLAAGDGSEEAQFDVGVGWATRQVDDLVRQGVPGIHFYVLNQSRATAHVLDAVKLPRG